MPNPNSTQQPPAPAATAPAQNNNSSVPPVPDDLVSRASGVSPEPQNNNAPNESDILEGSGFNREQWNSMLAKLPAEQKQQLEAAYKSLQTGADKKFQKASELIKQAEQRGQRPSVRDLVNDPQFLAEAQAYAQQLAANQPPQGSNLSDEEWSALTPSEKEEIRAMKQQNFALQSQMSEFMRTQEDERIKQRYKNYDPTLVNKIVDDVMNRRVAVTREHLWRAHDYEDAVKRAYQLGKQDRQLDLNDKQNGSTNPGGGFNTTNADDVPAKQPGQSSVDYFVQLARRRLAQQRQKVGKS